MNKTKTLFLLFVLMAATIISVNAQKLEEGKLTYEISYPDSEIPDEQMAMMPTEMTMQFKEMKSRMDMKMGMGMSTIVITDGKTKSATTLMDIMGNKIAMKMTAEDMKKQKEKAGTADADVKVTDETKDIQGYKCKKAVVTTKDGTYDIYFTDDIMNKGEIEDTYKGITGMLMEYQMKQGPMTMKMTAKSVSKDKVDEKVFEIPAGYTEKTQEEMKKMFGGQ